ncbi:AMP-binding protein [Verticiella sediminum]|uniref:AMP-binding protein n=1 Tax=Verticiella sediminum TaxID=1247510 RepID=A0A556AS03_9BURK|nr:AMP-binding protein [Verticiella sediminum]TSH95708.1 AMP-binding protein [Verticiella sediminum]
MPEATPLRTGATMGALYLAALRSAPPQRLALVADEGNWRYGELLESCLRTAALLRERGLRHQDTIAFLMGNRAAALPALIAAQLLGLRSLSLHPMASEDDHAFVLADAGAATLVVDATRYAGRAEALRERVGLARVLPLEDGACGQGMQTASARFAPAALHVEGDAGDVTKLSYSGGTTGRSKGMLHTHRTPVTMVTQMLATYEWPQEVRYLVSTPISHASGALLLPTLLRGGTVYLAEKFSPTDFARRVREHRINFTFLVPTQIYGLLDDPAVQPADLASLELALYGASPIAPARLREALERFGPVFGQLYGQAEAPMTISYLRKSDHDLAHPERLASCGRPVIGNQVCLLDAGMREVGVGEVGELCVRSPLVMEGYLNRPEENAKVFAGDWLHTGDMARQDADGYLYIVDRAKDMIISGGFNVYPSEIENCLAQHPDVAMSAVIGVPHPKWGEAVTAIVVAKPGRTLASEEVVAWVLERKGAVNTPKAVVFAAELPLTALGKIDRKTLRASHWAGSERQVS